MPAHPRHNLLFVFTDQQHRYALGCMGTSDIQTPHLDQLARDGVLFRNAYSPCPICSPFRANLFSGLYASQTGAFRNQCRIPDDCTPLAEALNHAGYRTSYVGKWHLGASGNRPIPPELRGGFQDFVGYQCYNGFQQDIVFFDENEDPHEFGGQHRTDVTTNLAVTRLEHLASATPETPFALFVSYQAPHYPVQPAPEYAERYAGVTITRRPNMEEVDPYTPTHSPPSPKPRERDPDFQRYGNDLDEYLRLYYAMITQVDAGVGRLLATLDRLGVAEDTVVVFTSDHGDMQGAHGLKNKTKPYEESAGIPLVVRVPGGARGLVTEALVSGVDFYPTLLAYAGLPVPEELPGTSFAPLTRGKPQELAGPVFSEMRDWKMVRRGDLKLVTRGATHEPYLLFDLAADPYEQHNLIAEESYAPAVLELRDVLLTRFRHFHTAEWLGATIRDLAPREGDSEKDGVVTFSTVPPESPAAFFGFQSRDMVLRVGDAPVTTAGEFLEQVRQLGEVEGRDVPVHLRRGERDLVVTL